MEAFKSVTSRRARLVGGAAALALALSIVGAGLGTAVTSAQDVGTMAVGGGTNPTTISVQDGGRGVPYPSTIRVERLPGTIEDVTVTLNNISHTNPDDLDVLLEAPNGDAILLMSDAGGTANVTTPNVTFDDTAADTVEDEGPLEDGEYRPSDFAPADDVFGAAPGVNGTAFEEFDGANPNGVWKLYVKDDQSNDLTGSIAGGWTLRVTTSNSPPSASPDSYDAAEGERLKVNRTKGVLSNDGDPDRDDLRAQLDIKPKKGRVTLKTNGSFTYTPRKDEVGTDSFFYRAVDGDGRTSRAKVTIDIKENRDRDRD